MGGDDGAGTTDNASSAAPTRIMRCRTNGGEPFCDTWWSVEPSRDEPGTVDLVFGTALLNPDYNHNDDDDENDDDGSGKDGKKLVKQSSSSGKGMLFKWMIAVLDP